MTDDEIRSLFGEMRGHFDAATEEMRRHFDVTAEAMTREVRIVAEGLELLDQKLDLTAIEIRDEMRRGFNETNALIRFSYGDLDRRVRAIEEPN